MRNQAEGGVLLLVLSLRAQSRHHGGSEMTKLSGNTVVDMLKVALAAAIYCGYAEDCSRGSR